MSGEDGPLRLDGAPKSWRRMGSRPVVVVQGLGFVGAAMCVAVASATDADGEPAFDVVGVDRDDPHGRDRVDALNAGRLPFVAEDPALADAARAAHERGNLACCWDEDAYSAADIVVVDVPLDVDWAHDPPLPSFEPFRDAVRAVARRVQPGTLVLIETTVPPGTTEHVVRPLVEAELAARGLDGSDVLLAHSYERVMPGPGYLASITAFWRVYGGVTAEAADATERFLACVVDVDRFPLRRLDSTTASETAKVLENAFRATTIALMDEWSRFAEAAGVDLFQVVEAIRDRPTHSNIRTPGLGVGGYCLTKDPLFGALAASSILELDVEFPLSTASVGINRRSPLAAVRMATDLVGGSLDCRRVLLCGVSYRAGVADTRCAPTETFARALLDAGADLSVHDPLVEEWTEMGITCRRTLPTVSEYDLVVFAVDHPVYRTIDVPQWVGDHRPAVLDAFDVLAAQQRHALEELGCRVASVGRGRPRNLQRTEDRT